MINAGSPARLRVLAVVLPLLVATALAAGLVIDRRSRNELSADAQARAEVAQALPRLLASVSQQVSTDAARVDTGRVALPPDGGALTERQIEARDTGAPTLDDATRPASIIRAVFRSGAPVASTAQRRAAVVGFRSTPLSVAADLSAGATATGGLRLRGPHGQVVEQSHEAAARSRIFAVDVRLLDQPGWRLEGWVTTADLSRWTWLGALGLLLLGCFGSGLAASWHRNQARAERRLARAERGRDLLSSLAPVVQTSLDLAQVLPSMSAELSDRLQLRGLSVSVPRVGRERELFAWGVRPDPAVLPTYPLPASLEAGRTFAVSLARGGRVLGLLRVVTGSTLLDDDLHMLVTASVLFGSTLANAEAFAAQEQLMEQLRSVDELKTHFLATASHELRTPVTAIVGFSSLVLSQWDAVDRDKGRQYLERVQSNATALDSLIGQLLDFSRLERGQLPIGDELLDLAETTARILEQQPELYADHQLVLALEPGCTLRGSCAAIERIVSNLVSNAAKYSAGGTTVRVCVAPSAAGTTLQVDDEGPGVPLEDRDRVFTRFFRGRQEHVTSTRGVGIGLAIVAEYAASMHGSVSVGEAPTGGARFTVTFPLPPSTFSPTAHDQGGTADVPIT